MKVRDQQLYIPLTTDDGTMPLIKSIDNSVRGLNNELYKHRHETEHRFVNVERDVSELKAESKEIHADVQELKSSIRELIVKLDGNADRLDTRVDGLEKRIDDLHNSHNKWFTVFGVIFGVTAIAVAVVQVLK